MTGFMVAAYDIASASFSLPVTHYGHRGHRPRLIFYCALVFVFACLLFFLPSQLVGDYTDYSGGSGEELCLISGGI